MNDPKAGKDSKCHWSQIFIPGELKSNPSADIASKAWLDIGGYAREVLASQDTRRFVLGFTLCGSMMRLWEFDRLGGIASEKFDINADGLQFVSRSPPLAHHGTIGMCRGCLKVGLAREVD